MRYALLLLVLIACGEPFSPQGAEPLDPPPVVAEWWAAMQACSGRSGELARIRWYVVPAREFVVRDSLRWGYWVAPHTIYLTSEIPSPTNGLGPWHQEWMRVVVSHELLHDLTGPSHGPVFDDCGVRALR